MTDAKDDPKRTLEALLARGRAEAEARPRWTASPELREARAELRRIDDQPDPEAPDPIVVLPEKRGEVLVSQAEAAETYVAPITVQPGEVPRIPTGPVRIRTDMDLRRQKTQPSLGKVAVPAAAVVAPGGEEPSKVAPGRNGRGAQVPASHPPPPSTQAATREPPRRGRLLFVAATAAVAAVVLFVLLRGPARNGGSGASGAMGAPGANTVAGAPGAPGTGAVRPASTGAVRDEPGGGVVPAAASGAGPMIDSAAGGGSGAPGGAGAASAVPVSPSGEGVKEGAPGGAAAPSGSVPGGGGVKPGLNDAGDPYGDGGAGSVKAAPGAAAKGAPSVAPSVAPVASAVPSVAPAASAVPSGAPAASVVPSVKPAVTAAPSVKPAASGAPVKKSWDVIFDSKEKGTE